jgi:N-acetylglucosamine-6-sulfatase
MIVRKLFVLGLAGVAALPAGASSTSDAATPAPRPNIVFVMSDDQTVESLRVMTNVNELLVRQGATFANNYASFPLCCPSRATFLTGQYAHNNTIMGNAPPQGGYEKLRPTEANTLPAWLRAAGYHTVHIGKYLNGYGRTDPTHVPAGWTEWYGSVDPSTYRFYGYTLNENGRLVNYGSSPQEYQADVYTAKVLDAVRRLAPRAEPFFLSVAYLAPHSGGPRESDDPANQATPVPAPRHKNRFASEPLPTPPSLNEADVSDKPAVVRNRRPIPQRRLAAVTENYRQRLESLLAVDEGVAAIVRALQAAGELERTLLVYTADNGFFHGEHRIPAGKVQLYEPSIRVPLILRGPGVRRGVRMTQAAINVDLAPTLVDAANARPGRTFDGMSLLPLLRNRNRFVGRDVLLETPQYSALHTPRYVYAEYASGDRELYDLAADPHQLASRHADAASSATRAELARRLAALRRCSGASCRVGPRVSLRLSCSRGRVTARLLGADTALIARADFRFSSRRVVDRRRPFAVAFPGRRGTLSAVAYLGDGRARSLAASARCR